MSKIEIALWMFCVLITTHVQSQDTLMVIDFDDGTIPYEFFTDIDKYDHRVRDSKWGKQLEVTFPNGLLGPFNITMAFDTVFGRSYDSIRFVSTPLYFFYNQPKLKMTSEMSYTIDDFLGCGEKTYNANFKVSSYDASVSPHTTLCRNCDFLNLNFNYNVKFYTMNPSMVSMTDNCEYLEESPFNIRSNYSSLDIDYSLSNNSRDEYLALETFCRIVAEDLGRAEYNEFIEYDCIDENFENMISIYDFAYTGTWNNFYIIGYSSDLVTGKSPEISSKYKINIYPNPVSEVLNLSAEVSCELFNIQGVIARKGTSNKVDVNSLPSGIYVLQAEGTQYRVIVK